MMSVGLGLWAAFVHGGGSRLPRAFDEKRGMPQRNPPLWFSKRISIADSGVLWRGLLTFLEVAFCAASSIGVASITDVRFMLLPIRATWLWKSYLRSTSKAGTSASRAWSLSLDVSNTLGPPPAEPDVRDCRVADDWASTEGLVADVWGASVSRLECRETGGEWSRRVISWS